MVEKTVGNNFRTRIYPIPARGYKRVVIGVEEALHVTGKKLVYQLPLYAEQPMKSFALSATLHKTAQPSLLENNMLNGFQFSKDDGNWKANFKADNFTAGHLVEFAIPEQSDMVYTEKGAGKTYFYAHTTTSPEYQTKKNPASITLLWDVSASGDKRNIINEIELLRGYFDRLENVTVNLVPFNITALPAQQFIIKDGDASALIQKVQAFDYDGGTQLGAIRFEQFKTEEILLFTDGLSTFGKKEMAVAAVPVTVINSSSSANYSYLKNIALQSHGRFINLAETKTEIALEQMAKAPLQFINATYNKEEVTDLAVQTNTQLQDGFSFAGILKNSTASVTLNFGYGNKVTTSKTVQIKDDGTNTEGIKRIWATTKIAQLDLEYDKNKEAITQLGKRFSVVTQNTSLIVLDRVEDYVEHEIEPPTELKSEYYALLEEKQWRKRYEKREALSQAITAMNEMKSWYNQNTFSYKGKKAQEDVQIGTINQEGIRDEFVVTSGLGTDASSTNSAASEPQMEKAQFAPPAVAANEEARSENKSSSGGNSGLLNFQNTNGNSETNYVVDASSSDVHASTSSIQLSEWSSDAEYLKELEKTPAAKQFEKYLSLRKDYLSQPSFFIDVARFFYAGNNKALALQILSNVAEMKLENPELLRTIANQLTEWGEKELAAEVFKEVLNIREEEPQSYRDLALAYNEVGKHQEAVDLLYKIVTGTWDERFFSIKGIALNEMNAIISGHSADVNVAAIDKQFIQAMPVDVRIVIGWSSNDSDVDLWVTDPNREKCSYQNNTTRAGGKISGDITQGYGPEEFCVRKATNGNYEVNVNLYGDTRQTLGGPITIKAELFINFGKPTQQRKIINCRVTSDKEVVRIGALHFGS